MSDKPINGAESAADEVPGPPRLTLDDARIQLAESVMKNLQLTIRKEEERLARDTTLHPAEVANMKQFMLAAAELIVTLRVQVERFKTPRILRPNRSVKISRG